MRAILVNVAPKDASDAELFERSQELQSLVSTYGGIVVVEHIQRRATVDYRTYVGSGKLEEILDSAETHRADVIILGNVLKPAQTFYIGEIIEKRKLSIEIWDRVDLILKIFTAHAKTPEAKLQIELASIRHMGPRIFGMGIELSRQGGGSKLARGKGETNTEIMRRHLREREEDVRKRLKKYERTRSLHRQNRKRKGYPTFGIVGYTSAGKSTLMNTLTGKGVLSENKLFATLETSTGTAYLAWNADTRKGLEVLVSDTIGFIRDLPNDLVSAFTATLEDSVESDVLLHVVDAGSPQLDEHLHVVNETLASLGASQSRLIVFNKWDTIHADIQKHLLKLYAHLDPIPISAETGAGIDTLKQRMFALIHSSSAHWPVSQDWWYDSHDEKRGVYLIIDTETTGFDPYRNGLVECACAVLDDRLDILDTFQMDVCPPDDADINEESLQINGFTRDRMCQGVSYAEFTRAFCDFFLRHFRQKPVVIGQFFPFDYAFLCGVFSRVEPEIFYDGNLLWNNFIDTKSLVNYANLRASLVGEPMPYPITSLSAPGGLKDTLAVGDDHPAHTALGDVLATRDVLLKIIANERWK